MTKLSKIFLLSAAATAMVAATTAHAQTRTFDIPSEDAARSIPEFARQSGLQITAPVSQLHGVKTPALKGDLDARAALRRLLAGTGLVIAADTRSTIILRRGNDAATEPSAAGSKPPPPEEIVVTGSRIRGAGPTGSEVIELSRRDIVAQGYTTVADAIRSLPQQVNAGPNEYTATFGSAGGTQLASTNHTGGTAINLRGLGANSTLTLIDGHRVASSGPAANFYDISVIPLSAIERVEILADGASAVYGSDAVGGVVNIILRKDFSGAETSLDYGAADGFWRASVDQVAGLKWKGGHALFTYQHLKQSNLSAASRDYVRQDLRLFGGTDQRSPNYGEPGTISVGGKTYAIPAGQNGRSLSSSALVPGTSNREDVYPYLDIIPSKKQDSMLLTVSQDLTDNLEIYGQGMASFRSSLQRTSPARSVLSVPKTNAFWVSPSPTATSESVYYSYDNEFGGQRFTDHQTDFGGTIGARLKLDHEWSVDAAGSYAKENLRQDVSGIVNSFYLNRALASSDPNTAFTPFGDGTGNSASVIQSIAGYQHYRYQAVTKNVTAQADGPLFSLPGGEVRVAFGGEVRHEDIQQDALLFSSTQNPVVPSGLIDLGRDIQAEFAELNVPVVGPGNRVGWLHGLTFSAAVRHEHYSDVGSTTNPRLGAEASFAGGLTLRGSYGTSFSAPLLIQLAASPIIGLVSTVPDPKSPTGQSTVIVRSGNDPALKPETARNWSFGATWAPSSLRGFKVEATYFNIDFTNRIASPANFTVMLQQESIYSGLIIRNPTAAQVNAIQNDPRFGSTPVNPATVAAILDIRSRNEAEQFIDGLDLSATLTRPSFGGRITAFVSGTKLFNDKISIAPGTPRNQFLDNAFYPTAWKTRSSVGWEGGGVAVAAYLNWQNGYKFVTGSVTTPIHSFTTVDLSANLDLGKIGLRALSGAKLTFAVQNLFNAAPPFLNVAGGYDAINASALGRFVSARLTYDW